MVTDFRFNARNARLRPVSCRVLLIGLAAALLAQAAEGVGPSEFYAVSVSFSDYGLQYFYRVVDVKADGSDSLVRYVRVAPSNVYCPKMIVQAVEARIRNTSPIRLVRNNPCAVTAATLHAALRMPNRVESVFETISYGVVAQCGASAVVLDLPISEKVDLKRMKRAHPEIAGLWDLVDEITSRAFGSKDVFRDRTEEEDLLLQQAGERLVPELVSGRFDQGLDAAVKGNVGSWNSPNFRSLLAGYHGPIGATEAAASYVPQLLNAQKYRFIDFRNPKFPPLAMQARIQGRVELELNVDLANGAVRNAVALSGHPLLQPGAIDSAKEWRFAPHSLDSEIVNVTVDYALRCP